jgi:outer membrane receptor protein involved in Fe transport
VEVLRGPGGALYGSVAVLGVVNIITKGAASSFFGREKRLKTHAAITAEELGKFSYVQKMSIGFSYAFSKKANISVNFYKFQGDFLYDTKTAGTPRPWNSRYAREGAGMANVRVRNQVFTEVPNDGSFRGGKEIPSFDIRLNTAWFTVGSFLHSRALSWVPPIGNQTFNHQQNDWQWSSGSVFAELKPLKFWDFSANISGSINTNRQGIDFSTGDFIPGTTVSLSQNAGGNVYGGGAGNRYLLSDGNYVHYPSTVDLKAFTDSSLNMRGGGLLMNYAGITKSFGADFQMKPISNPKLTLTAGGNFEYADYKNIQWFSGRDYSFISYRPGGGITDFGWY